MKLAVITPTVGWHYIKHLGYHMALGQKLFQDPDYYNCMWDLALKGHFIIVDNGAAEPEEERESFPNIAHAALELGASEIVLPDVIRSSAKTVEKSLDSNVLHMVPQHKRFVVPQGASWAEWTYCLDKLVLHAQPATVGVPKWLDGPNGLPGGRPRALRIMMSRSTHLKCNIHLLGIAKHSFEEIYQCIKVYPGIRGIDTGAPVAFAQHKLLLNDDKHFSLDWTTDVDRRILKFNIETLNDWCSREAEVLRVKEVRRELTKLAS